LDLNQLIAPKLVSIGDAHAEQKDLLETKAQSLSPHQISAEEDKIEQILPVVVTKASTTVC
jgi:hypothetical protein